MNKKTDKKLFGLSFGDLGSAVFSMKEISRWEESAMSTAAYFAKVLATKRGKIQAAKEISSFIDQRFGDGKEKDVRLLVCFLNRCLGYDTKRYLREALEMTDPKLKAKLTEFGFIEYSA